MSKGKFKQTIDDFFKDKNIVPPQPTHSNYRLSQTVYVGPVCIQSIQRLQKRDTDSQYETRLALPSWKFISATSLRIFYILPRSVNISFHIFEWLCTFPAVWTSILRVFLKFHICHYKHIDHKICKFGCELSITKFPLLEESFAISAVSPFLY